MKNTNSSGFEIQTHHQISARRPDLIIINNKERSWRIVNFAILEDHRVKLKECEKRAKYFNLERVLKNLWNMKVKTIAIAIVTLGTVIKRLVQGRIRGLGNNGTGGDFQFRELLRST